MDFQPMRRKDRLVGEDQALEMLARAKWGTLSLTADENGYPFAVPINCAYVDGALYFHGAMNGSKMRLLQKDSRACFSVVLSEQIVLESFRTLYESVVCYGRVTVLEGDERVNALISFTAALFDVDIGSVGGRVRQAAANTAVLRMDIDHITGKCSK